MQRRPCFSCRGLKTRPGLRLAKHLQHAAPHLEQIAVHRPCAAIGFVAFGIGDHAAIAAAGSRQRTDTLARVLARLQRDAEGRAAGGDFRGGAARRLPLAEDRFGGVDRGAAAKPSAAATSNVRIMRSPPKSAGPSVLPRAGSLWSAISCSAARVNGRTKITPAQTVYYAYVKVNIRALPCRACCARRHRP